MYFRVVRVLISKPEPDTNNNVYFSCCVFVYRILKTKPKLFVSSSCRVFVSCTELSGLDKAKRVINRLISHPTATTPCWIHIHTHTPTSISLFLKTHPFSSYFPPSVFFTNHTARPHIYYTHTYSFLFHFTCLQQNPHQQL